MKLMLNIDFNYKTFKGFSIEILNVIMKIINYMT